MADAGGRVIHLIAHILSRLAPTRNDEEAIMHEAVKLPRELAPPRAQLVVRRSGALGDGLCGESVAAPDIRASRLYRLAIGVGLKPQKESCDEF